jgi:hypothetical protein
MKNKCLKNTIGLTISLFLMIFFLAPGMIFADVPPGYWSSPPFAAGDANNSGSCNGLDVIYLVAYFKGGPPPPYYVICDNISNKMTRKYPAADANGSCSLNGLDVTYLVSFLKGGDAPTYCQDHDCTTDRPLVDVFDSDIPPGSNVTWTSNNIYVLNEFVFVDSGATLTIEPNTIVKGLPGQGASAKALIVAKWGTLIADGNATNPIIFTSIADYTSIFEDLPANPRGLWGGMLILGNAVINTAAGVGQIEGIPETEPRGAYGGSDDTDSSGVLRYVSVRYGGSEIGAANEINGITFGAVGNRTVVEHVEVANNLDDGFEWFGGTVNCKWMLVAFVGDDNYDYDEGYRGFGQFWACVQDPTTGNRGGEHDGGTDPEDGTPYAIPTISNATYIGSGASSGNIDSDHAFKIRDNAGGHYSNSIFTEFYGDGLDVEDLPSGHDSRERLETGDLTFTRTLWYNFGAGDVSANLWPQSYVETYMTNPANNNQIVNPVFNNIDWTFQGFQLDPRVDPSGPAGSGASTPADPWFDNVSYYGAFAPTGDMWIKGWTWLWQAGYAK